MNLLSVVVPVYNSEKRIEQCIRSIINQTYNNLEIIIIDDGSTDSSCELCKAFAVKDARIKLLCKTHLGVVATRKTGISMATGEYITFVDSDDWVELDYYERLMSCVKECDVLITGHFAEVNQRVIKQPIETGIYFENKREIVWKKLFSKYSHDAISSFLWDKLFKTELVKKAIEHVNDQLYISEDKCIVVQAILLANNIKVTDEIGYHYYKTENSLTNSIHDDYLININLFYQCMKNILKQYSYADELLMALDQEMLFRLRSCWSILGIKRKALESFWYYPYYGRLRESDIILYGAGKVGQSYYYQIKQYAESKIVAWVDRNYEQYRKYGLNVISPTEIKNLKFEYIIIAVCDEKIALNIKNYMIDMGISPAVVLWNRTKLDWD